jgi:glucokinase
MERSDPAARKALELFVSVYGAEAGNLALKILATGGVYVGGGIAPKILLKLQEGEFVRSFVMKGRYEGLMRQMPVWVILNDRIAIVGAAHHAVMDR